MPNNEKCDEDETRVGFYKFMGEFLKRYQEGLNITPGEQRAIDARFERVYGGPFTDVLEHGLAAILLFVDGEDKRRKVAYLVERYAQEKGEYLQERRNH